MKKTRSFLLTAGIALVTAFTFSCSGDNEPNDNPGGGGYLSCTQAQGVMANCSAYSDEQKDECRIQGLCGSNSRDVCVAHYQSECPELFGNPPPPDLGPGGVNLSELSNQPVAGADSNIPINLYMIFRDREGEQVGSIQVGSIQGGLLTVALPAEAAIAPYLSVLGGGASSVRISSFTADIPGKENCRIRPYLGLGEDIMISLWYLSKAIYVPPDPDENFDLNFSHGWNFVYERDSDDYITTDRSRVGGGTLEWRLENCSGD